MPERYLSPALHDQDAMTLLMAPLVGIEAKIYNDLWNAVINRKLRPGAKLEESVIGEIYGISRTVIRKVLFIMEQEGIVSLPANRGAYIASPSFRDAEELLESVSASLIYFIGELATHPERITKEQRDKLADHIKAQEKANADQDFHTARRLNNEFCLLLALIHGNRLMAGVFDRQMNLYSVALASYQVAPPSISRAEFTTTLTRHIFDGEPAEAVAYYRTVYDAIRRTLRPDGGKEEIDLRAILTVASR